VEIAGNGEMERLVSSIFHARNKSHFK